MSQKRDMGHPGFFWPGKGELAARLTPGYDAKPVPSDPAHNLGFQIPGKELLATSASQAEAAVSSRANLPWRMAMRWLQTWQ